MRKLFFSFCYLFFIHTAFCQNIAWSKSIGSTFDDNVTSTAIDAKGNLYITGTLAGTVDFDPGPSVYNLTSAGSTDVFISKLDSSGNFIWAKSFGNIGAESGKSLALDKQGNIYLTGDFEATVDFDPGSGNSFGTSVGGVDFFILKLDSLANFVWAKIFGGTSLDAGNALVVGNSGNVYATGFFRATVDFDPNAGTQALTAAVSADIFILKLDSLGSFVWAKYFAGQGQDNATSIALDSLENVFTTGSFFGITDFDPGVGTCSLTPGLGAAIFVSKLDSSGSFVWAKKLANGNNDDGRSIAVNRLSGNVYTTGRFYGPGDFDPGPGTYTLTGGPSSSGIDAIAYVSKLSNAGNFVWAKIMGGPDFDVGMSIATDKLENTYVTGSFQVTGDFDPGINTYSLTSNGLDDVFIAKLDSLGNFVWAKSFGGTNFERGLSICATSSGAVYTSGGYYNTVAFDQNNGTNIHTSVGGRDMYVIKLVPSVPVSITEIGENDYRVTYENPNNGNFNIQAKTPISLSLMNSYGELIMKSELNSSNNYMWNIENLTSGVYFIVGQDKNKIVKQKIIVTK